MTQVVTPVKTQDEETVPVFDTNAPLPAWYTIAVPHFDIRNGVLDESVFAANLNEVDSETGPEVYSNPSTFFEKTYVTDGLRDIANRVVRALNGEESENRVISLQTGFGGGKTHTLISLYHIAKSGSRMLNIPSCRQMLHNGVAPKFEQANVCVFTNNTTDIIQGRHTDDRLTIYTLWGEIAYQLGGKEAYLKIKENDVQRTPPTSAILKPILEQASPALILIDELADYCSRATSKKVGTGTLYNQTNSFVQTLTEVVASVPKCVLIATLPASANEIANSAVGQEVLSSLETRIVRVGTSVKPVDDEEIFEVVRRRLFESFTDEAVIEQVANKYKKMYYDQKKNYPDEAGTATYAAKIRRAYPFHPELIDMFRLRWGDDHRFQRTRGVLRLLASIVQDLWKRRSSLTGTQALIQTSDVCLENLNTLTGMITSLMGSQWETVMHADIFGSSSNAYKIDNEETGNNYFKFRLTQSLASTLLMASVGGGQHKGMDLKQLKLCVMKPASFNHNDVDGAMNNYEQVAHYLYKSTSGGIHYWFQSKPNINILINQATSEIRPDDMNAEILRRLKALNWSSAEMKVLVDPTSDVPEQKELTLVVLSPKYAVPFGDVPPAEKHYVENIALHRGNNDRIYRNTILYLVCSEAGRAVLNEKIKAYLSCERILSDYANQLEKDQKEEILNRRKSHDKEIAETLISAYNTVIRYSAKSGLDTYELKSFANDFVSQIANNLLKELQEEEWVVATIGRGLLQRNNLFPDTDNRIQVCKIADAFLRYDDKPKILSLDAVRNTVNKYCSDGLFNVAVIVDGIIKQIYNRSTVPFLNVTDDTYWLVDESEVMPKDDTPATPTTPVSPSPNPQIPTTPTKTDSKSYTPTPTAPMDAPRVVNKLVISGKPGWEYWTQMFNSFVNQLKSNHLEIEVTFTATSTPTHPITDTSATYRSVKESAIQLGLEFKEEE